MTEITHKQIKRAIKFAKPVIYTRFEDPTAAALLNTMKHNYAVLAPELPELNSSFNRMTLKIAVDVLAFYRALLTELTQKEALPLIEPFVNSWMDGQFDRWIARKVYANRFLHRLYRRFWFDNANRHDEADGQKFEYIPPTANLFYGINVVRCGMVKFLFQMGAPELTPLICRGDFHIGRYLPQGVTFERTQVIAEGAAYCNFRYYFK